jgi:hypothetical protein
VDFVPTEKSSKFTNPKIDNPKISVDNCKICIELCHAEYYAYLINRQENQKNTVVYDGIWQNKLYDEPPVGTYSYTVTPYFKNGEKVFYGKSVTLPTVQIVDENSKENGQNLQAPPPKILEKDWYND